MGQEEREREGGREGGWEGGKEGGSRLTPTSRARLLQIWPVDHGSYIYIYIYTGWAERDIINKGHHTGGQEGEPLIRERDSPGQRFHRPSFPPSLPPSLLPLPSFRTAVWKPHAETWRILIPLRACSSFGMYWCSPTSPMPHTPFSRSPAWRKEGREGGREGGRGQLHYGRSGSLSDSDRKGGNKKLGSKETKNWDLRK